MVYVKLELPPSVICMPAQRAPAHVHDQNSPPCEEFETGHGALHTTPTRLRSTGDEARTTYIFLTAPCSLPPTHMGEAGFVERSLALKELTHMQSANLARLEDN